MVLDASSKKINNPWYYAYWFSRELISKDKYIDIGNKPELLTQISSSLNVVADEVSTKEKLEIQKQTLKTIIENKYCKNNNEKLKIRAYELINYLDGIIISQDIMNVFIFTCEHILKTLKETIKNIPNNDLKYTKNIAEAYLKNKGIKGLEDIILLWDDLGVKGCINAERLEIVRSFTTLKVILENDKIPENEKDIILTGFIQEFERRAAQKRKSRAGGSLENVIKIILDHFNIKYSDNIQHIKIDLEVDYWISIKGGWNIGISCKRINRERWKQVMSANDEELTGYKIKYIFHIMTFDSDLSNDKIRSLSSRRHIIFLSDKSERLKEIMKDEILRKNVKPLSSIIDILKE